MKIYVASSWRNILQQHVVNMLRNVGHEVYDFHHPEPGNNGFKWSEIDPAWQDWTPKEFAANLDHPIALNGFALDYNAMEQADACVLVMPCGRSAHLEAGWMAGKGKLVVVLIEEKCEPELMYLLTDEICTSVDQLEWILEEREIKVGVYDPKSGFVGQVPWVQFRPCQGHVPQLQISKDAKWPRAPRPSARRWRSGKREFAEEDIVLRVTIEPEDR
jgi:hypothetical protein